MVQPEAITNFAVSRVERQRRGINLSLGRLGRLFRVVGTGQGQHIRIVRLVRTGNPGPQCHRDWLLYRG